MKKNRGMYRVLTCLLSLTLLLTACSAGGGGSADQNTQLRLQGDSVATLPYQPESPPAAAAGALGSSRVSNTSTTSSGSLFGSTTAQQRTRLQLTGEIRAVWVSYLEMESLLKNKTESQFTSNIAQVMQTSKDYGLNTVIVQVRPFADALYNSDYYPWSYTITGTEGRNPGFDPLQIMVQEAHSRGLRIEAWINPYRVRAAGNTNAISQNNQAQIWLNSGNSAVVNHNGVISYNPASQAARELIVNGAVEIVRNYDVDGIHIDDYFYPSTDAAFDASSYSAYQSGGGTMSLADWRRGNVELLVQSMYQAIKAEDDRVTFGISPQSSVYNNYHAQYLDVEKIASTAGYCDYICPQIYFGYQNGTQPYRETLETWSRMVEGSPVQLYVGVAVYKCGVNDSWAGAGSQEWVNNTDMLSRMVQTARGQNSYGGFVLYRYDSLFNPASNVASHVGREHENLRAILS